MTADTLLPWLAVLVAWLSFGSYAVPMKSKAVVDADVHPLIYQAYKSFWVFATCWLVLLIEPFEFSFWGLASGLFWVPSGIAAVIAVRNVGIAYAQAIWQVAMILTNFAWGFFILHDEGVKSVLATVAAVALIVGGVVGMTMALHWKPRRLDSLKITFLEEAREGSENEDDAHPSVSAADCHKACDDRKPQGSFILGTAAALFVGIWGGSNLIPAQYTPYKGVHFVISFGVGSMLTTIGFLLTYFLYLTVCRREPLPPFHPRAMALPGFLSGCLWALGNFCSLYLVNAVGQGIGTAFLQSSVIVSGLWGILYYKEMKGTVIFYWMFSCLLCLAGTLLLAHEKK
eukprot:TRINITY_DN18232_c0_g1_i2.p1 TRINITY_DN18232_c0_g1~~TRINITY_DN18232_c0_g1_i2.p1  ORF type:complete len:343 (+),score=57.87 TRINITY_DN18232_c0_g1_i2:86-1114(+)